MRHNNGQHDAIVYMADVACSRPPDTDETPVALADVSKASGGAFRMLCVLQESCAAVCFEAVFHWTCRRPGPEHACACTAVHTLHVTGGDDAYMRVLLAIGEQT